MSELRKILKDRGIIVSTKMSLVFFVFVVWKLELVLETDAENHMYQCFQVLRVGNRLSSNSLRIILKFFEHIAKQY